MCQNVLSLRFLYAVCVAMLALLPLAFPHAQRPPAFTIRVAAQPLTNFTPLLIAEEKGWFAEENLTVTST